MNERRGLFTIIALIIGLALVGCSPSASNPGSSTEEGAGSGPEVAAEVLTLPDLDAVDLGGGLLKVVTTTSISGDVVSQVGGDHIELTTLIGPGQDPHSYEPAARDLTALADSHIVFVNGWNLEEGLVDDLVEIAKDVPVVAISANITPLGFGEDDHDHEVSGEAHDDEGQTEHGHGGADPHVWFNINHVKQWVENIKVVLSDLDPGNAETYSQNAAAYLVELEALEAYVTSQLAEIPEDRRFLVTNHESLQYFAQEYGFTILGTVIPTTSAAAEPSARDLANLIEDMKINNVCVLITETTVSDTLAQTVANELDSCNEVQVLQLYTGAVGPINSGADSYLGMFRANVDTLTKGLR